MEQFEIVHCPFCGTRMDLAIDTSAGAQSLTTDCETCCRPFEVRVECDQGEVLRLEVVEN